MAPGLVQALEARKDPWNVNVLAQYYGVAALEDQAFIAKSKQYISKEKDRFYEKMNSIPGIKAYLPTVNFMLCELENRQLTVRELQDRLRPHHILIRNCEAYDGLDPYFFRIAIKTTEENNTIYEKIKAVLE